MERQEETKEKTSEKTQEEPPKKKLPLILGGVAAMLAAACIGVYFYGVSYYKSHFLPHTYINSMDCSGQMSEETAEKLTQQFMAQYSLQVTGRQGEEVLNISPADCGMQFLTADGVETVLAVQNAYAWPMAYLTGKENRQEIAAKVTFEPAILQAYLEQQEVFDNSHAVLPVNAYIGDYVEEKMWYEIVPEVEGTVLVQEQTIQQIEAALEKQETIISLEETDCYRHPEITADDEALTGTLNQLNTILSTSITYDWNGRQELLDAETIHNWIIFDGKEVSLDEEQIAAYVTEKAKEFDTYNRKFTFVTTTGREVTLLRSGYGWRTDKEAEAEALQELIWEGTVTDREPEYLCTGWAKGEDDIGDSYVEIDLSSQHLYLYEEGEIVLESDFVSGNVANGNMTPSGIFGITYKTRDAVLRGETYETPVRYWMPFNGNIGMHDATWRRRFGGDIYLTNGSHGCINLPLKKAEEIYGYVATGFPVICYY